MKLISWTWKELRKLRRLEMTFLRSVLGFQWKVIRTSLRMRRRYLTALENFGNYLVLSGLISRKATISVRLLSYSLWAMRNTELKLEAILRSLR